MPERLRWWGRPRPESRRRWPGRRAGRPRARAGNPRRAPVRRGTSRPVPSRNATEQLSVPVDVGPLDELAGQRPQLGDRVGIAAAEQNGRDTALTGRREERLTLTDHLAEDR